MQALQTFAAGLPQDLGSIEAALATRWRNGPTQGHVNRPKWRKRQMHGRARLRSATPSPAPRLLIPHEARKNREIGARSGRFQGDPQTLVFGQNGQLQPRSM